MSTFPCRATEIEGDGCLCFKLTAETSKHMNKAQRTPARTTELVLRGWMVASGVFRSLTMSITLKPLE